MAFWLLPDAARRMAIRFSACPLLNDRDDPLDQRRRTAAILRCREESLLIDCGPDLLAQLRDPYCTWDGHSYPQHAVPKGTRRLD